MTREQSSALLSNCYVVLGLEETVSVQVGHVVRAYLKIGLEMHPRRLAKDEQAKTQFKVVENAYFALRDHLSKGKPPPTHVIRMIGKDPYDPGFLTGKYPLVSKATARVAFCLHAEDALQGLLYFRVPSKSTYKTGKKRETEIRPCRDAHVFVVDDVLKRAAERRKDCNGDVKLLKLFLEERTKNRKAKKEGHKEVTTTTQEPELVLPDASQNDENAGPSTSITDNKGAVSPLKEGQGKEKEKEKGKGKTKGKGKGKQDKATTMGPLDKYFRDEREDKSSEAKDD